MTAATYRDALRASRRPTELHRLIRASSLGDVRVARTSKHIERAPDPLGNPRLWVITDAGRAALRRRKR